MRLIRSLHPWACACAFSAGLAVAGAAWAGPQDPVGDFLHAQGWIDGPVRAEPNMSRLPLSDLVLHAMGFVGTPYQLGGNSVDTGFDCSGFVQTAFQQSLGVRLPRRAVEQAHATQTIEKTELIPGDLVFFNTLGRAFSHVGIYVGEGRFIHSPRTGAQVRLENMKEAYWRARFNGARRVEALAAGASALLNP